MHPESTLYWTPGFQQAQQPSDEEIAQVGKLPKQLKPTVVFVALGAPQQEFWILDNAAVLQAAGTKLAMAVGGSFDVLFGKLTQPPAWIAQLGFEWLYRLVQQPWRWRRQLRLFSALKVVIQLALKA